MTESHPLTPTMQRLLDAIRDGAELHRLGWQQYDVVYGPADPRNFLAREVTFYALRDRGLIVLDKDGVRLA